MQRVTLVQVALLLAAVLILLIAVSYKAERMDRPWRHFTGMLVRLLVFSQFVAVLWAALDADKDDLSFQQLAPLHVYAACLTLFGYTALAGTRVLATRAHASFHAGQVLEYVGTLFGFATGTVVANVVLHFAAGESFLWVSDGIEGVFQGIFIMILALLSLVFTSTRLFYNYRLYSEHQALDRQRYELLKLREQQARAQLQSIQARVHPHFLYNALGAVAGLVHEDPDRAERMTLGLARLFRASLDPSDDPFTTLRREVDFVRTYLDVEQTRFGPRLTSTIDVDPEALDAPLPRFLLQPLVENAVRHGVGKKPEGGHVGLEAHRCAHGLVIAVQDDGPDFPPDLVGGFGLRSVTDSLALLYPGRHTLRLVNGTDGQPKQVHLTLEDP